MQFNFNQQNSNFRNMISFNVGTNFGKMNQNNNFVGMPNMGTFNSNMNNFMNNNMMNQFNNINNNQFINNQNNQNNLKRKLFGEISNETDPIKIQMKIALGLNNNKSYENCVEGGNKGFSFMKQSSHDNRSKQSNDKINVIFKAIKGNIHNRFYDKNETIENMLLKFLESVGLTKYHLNKIYFIFNAVNLSTVNQKKTLREFGIKNNSNIVILDINDIIGA